MHQSRSDHNLPAVLSRGSVLNGSAIATQSYRRSLQSVDGSSLFAVKDTSALHRWGLLSLFFQYMPRNCGFFKSKTRVGFDLIWRGKGFLGCSRRIVMLVVGLSLSPSSSLAQLDGSLFRRVSRASNFEFAVFNQGALWIHTDRNANWYWVTNWPRGYQRIDPLYGNGLAVLSKKGDRFLCSDGNYFRPANVDLQPFNQMVPGRVGDTNAGYDSLFNGFGWRYVNDPNYIVYSSLDYNAEGFDTSGNNYHDWPIRMVGSKRTYVQGPHLRGSYPPAYVSDEDMFCIFKDTDTRADPLFTGPNGTSIPLGLEIQNTFYTWGIGPARDIVVIQYDLINKSGESLDSCHVLFGSSLRTLIPHKFSVHSQQPWRNLTFVYPTQPQLWGSWTGTPIPPTLGYSFLETPRGYSGTPAGLMRGVPYDSISWYMDSTGVRRFVFTSNTPDSLMYRLATTVNPWIHSTPPTNEFLGGPVIVTKSFQMAVDETVRTSIAIIFSDSLRHLLLLHDLITRMYASNFQRPSPPPPPRLTARGLNRAVKLTWDTSSESATDIIIPDSLGRAFKGYRLLRATARDGPYVQIGRWVRDSTLVHEYIDTGDSIAGLKNNVRYYYRLLAFDEGAKRLKLDPMESEAVEGVNAVSVIPQAEPSNATSSSSQGMLLSGELGDVSLPRLIPTNTTNFNGLMSGRTLNVSISASTDGVEYTLPVTIRDSLGGRVHNAIAEPGVLVHGSPSTAGIKSGSLRIPDVFGLGAADIELPYRFEQLADSFRILPPLIQTTTGADVPVIVNDSLRYTGIQVITPYTVSEQEVTVEFGAEGLDTLFGRQFNYLPVQVRDAVTGNLYRPDSDYTWSGTGIYAVGGVTVSGKPNRYYMTDTLFNVEVWEFGHVLTMKQTRIAFDYPDRGFGSGRPGAWFPWASGHRRGTKDFEAGDRVQLHWQGGIRGTFPRNAQVMIQAAEPGRTEVTDAMMESIRIVPNPFFVRDQGQTGLPRLYFNYLPDECTIRIYTVALDLVKTIHHSGGSREEWDLTSEGGQLVASQLLIAHIEASNGKSTMKKFAVVMGK